MKMEMALRAVSNGSRLRILEWLKRPEKHFPPQVAGDLVEDGVCGLLIANKLNVSQPTASGHLRILAQARLIESKRVKQWTFYKRNNAKIKELKKVIADEL